MAEPFDESGPEEVRTGADRLLELARSSKEIAIADAAKQLGASQATVEAWSNFLEEDGLIAVKYKFTTPYITVPEPETSKRQKQETATVDNLEFHELKNQLEGLNDSLLKAAEEKQAGEFGMLKQTYSNMISWLRSIHDSLIDKADLSPQKKAYINETIKAIEQLLKEAASEAYQGKFNEASASYARLQGLIKAASQELSKAYEQMAAMQSIQETKGYKDLIARAYELMGQGKVEESKELYNRLKFAKENLAKEFKEKKIQMEEDLIKLNNDLEKNIDHANRQKFSATASRISMLLHAGNKFLGEGEFGTADSYYLAIRKEYDTLPPGFTEQKKELQQGILRFYNSLAQEREKAIRKKFEEAKKHILFLIKQAEEFLKEGGVDNAIKAYGEISAIYRKLPAGFLKEKTELQDQILPLHTTITSTYTKASVEALKEKSTQILSLLAEMNSHTEKNELEQAEQAYQRLRGLYRAMPKGFLHEETTIQSQIVDSYERFLRKAKKTEGELTSSTLAGIQHLAGKAEASLKAKDHPAASSAYLGMVKAYESLPEGFMEQKKKLREKMLYIYKTLISLSGEQAFAFNGSMTEPGHAMAPESRAASKAESSEAVNQTAGQPAQEPTEEPKGALPDTENPEFEDAHRIDNEIEDVEEKIEQLKSASKATVKHPL